MKYVVLLISWLFFFSSLSCQEPNPQSLLDFITHNHRHGYKDDSLYFDEAVKVMKKRKLQMTCGSISNFSFRIFHNHEIPVRFILFLTLDEWNNYNNGHSLIEICDQGVWEMYDITFRNCFVKNNRVLNAWETLENIDSVKRIKFSQSPVLAKDDLIYNEVDYAPWYEFLVSEDGQEFFYKRCFQVLLIRKNGIFYFTCDPKYRERVESYPYCGPFVYMEKSNFLNTFYP